ncbi:MAG: hypothetical protein SO044_04290 [Agathobaculum sp.]|uniref:hypothetical protein n=1 Tax=Agathobaculum sp. TaxID=2048138 RepID=UPI002A8063D6|nr:hypothetical protein [Agathobaculum sp.]MDY3711619.1 hypothetical protein [Agathobaculum sp.]
MTKRLRGFRMLLAGVLTIAVLSAAVYIALAAEHDCTGECCTVCRQRSICENMLRSRAPAAVTVAVAAAPADTLCETALPRAVHLPADTLVSRKVKLSD